MAATKKKRRSLEIYGEMYTHISLYVDRIDEDISIYIYIPPPPPPMKFFFDLCLLKQFLPSLNVRTRKVTFFLIFLTFFFWTFFLTFFLIYFLCHNIFY